MAPEVPFDRRAGLHLDVTETVHDEEQRLDPKIEPLKVGASSTTLPSYLFIGLPICFVVALGVIMIGYRGAFTVESLVFFSLGAVGLLLVRYLNRHW